MSAYGRSSGLDHVMEVPGIGSFSFNDDTTDVIVVPEERADDDAVRETFRRMVVPMALHVRGVEVLHASGVRREDGIIALSGTSGAGKSTLAYGLSARGGELWADDVLAFTPGNSGVDVLPLPFRVRLLPDAAAALLGIDVHGTEKRTVGELRDPRGVVHLMHVVVLEPGSSPEVVPVRPATQALPLLLEHAFTFDVAQPGRIERTASTYAKLVARVPVHRVVVPPDPAAIDTVLDRIEAALGAADP